LTPLVGQVLQTGPDVEPVDHPGCERHRRAGGTMTSARASAGEDMVELAGSDHGDAELVTEDGDHRRGAAGQAEGRRRLPSAIPPAGLVLAVAFAELAPCRAAHRAGRPEA